MPDKDLQILRSVNYERSKFDEFILKIFKRVFLRWCDKHLNTAFNFNVIDSKVLHELDSQMKGDLGFSGYPRINGVPIIEPAPSLISLKTVDYATALWRDPHHHIILNHYYKDKGVVIIINSLSPGKQRWFISDVIEYSTSLEFVSIMKDMQFDKPCLLNPRDELFYFYPVLNNMIRSIHQKQRFFDEYAQGLFFLKKALENGLLGIEKGVVPESFWETPYSIENKGRYKILKKTPFLIAMSLMFFAVAEEVSTYAYGKGV